MRITVNKRFVPPAKVMEGLGVDARGRVQAYATERILFRMRRHMPWRTGLTATSLTQVSSPTSITVNAPYARYLYEGVSASGRPLHYNQTAAEAGFPRGDHWDRRLMQAEGAALAKEIEDYARRQA